MSGTRRRVRRGLLAVWAATLLVCVLVWAALVAVIAASVPSPPVSTSPVSLGTIPVSADPPAPFATVRVAAPASPARTVAPRPTMAPAVRVTTTTRPPTPVDGDCESWRPLLARNGIPFDAAVPIMRRESNCSMAVNFNPRTRDFSLGPFQVNRWGSLAAAWNRAGFTEARMRTPAGAVEAAALLFRRCGWGPWTRPYSCPAGWPL